MTGASRYEVAIHQAGHVFMQFHGGGTVAWVRVDMNDTENHGECHTDDMDISTEKNIKRKILTAVGGYAAEEVIGFGKDLEVRDYNCAVNNALKLKECSNDNDEYPDIDKVLEFVDIQTQEAIRCMRSKNNLSVLEELANRICKLSDGERVTGKELRKIYRGKSK